jgi:hypothetical protein
MKVLAFAAAAWVAVACADARPPRESLKTRMAKDSVAAATSTTTPPVALEPVAAICTDTSEAVAMRCAESVAMRSGDTVILRLSNVGAAKRVDDPTEGNTYRRYYYAGRFGGDNGTPAFHILDVRTWEGGAIELINAATGDSLVVHGVPILSPDGARFAAVAEPDACELATQIEIWRVTGDKPVHEYTIEPFDCMASRGWGPSDMTWRSRDSISFLRNTLPVDSARRVNGARDTTRALLVRVAGQWMLDTTAAARQPRRPADTH